ncbi:MAG TPA: hypothetical protein VK463_09990 [Desulfomonilaceae bacterium]|nr:hypothetical protein [Desulfomonilaceae bacterium]
MKKKVVRMTKVTKVIKVADILKDMLQDISDEELLLKYRIGWKQLEAIYGKLFYGGFLDTSCMRRRIDLRGGRSSAHIPLADIKDSGSVYTCLTCGYTSSLHFSACPRCRQVNLRRLHKSALPAAFPPYYAGYGV